MPTNSQSQKNLSESINAALSEKKSKGVVGAISTQSRTSLKQTNLNSTMKTINTKWYSLRSATTQLNREGVGRSNLLKILKQENVIQEDKLPKPNLIKRGLFKVKVYTIRTSSRGVVNFNSIQISAKGIDYMEQLLEKRDKKINLFNEQVEKLANRKGIIIRNKIKTI